MIKIEKITEAKTMDSGELHPLRQWREKKGWSRAHLANTLNKKLGRQDDELLTQSHVQSWENSVMPGADVGEALRKVTRGEINYAELAKKPKGE